MSEGGRQVRPGAPDAAELRDANDETFVPGETQKDRGWALHDRMRMVRAERQSSASQIHRSLTAWRKESGAAAAGGGAAQAKIPKSGGAALDTGVRKSMEGRLGADLANVKVHTGGDAAGAAEDLQARAFTVGEDVHFGAGQFAPGTKEGDRLLAHELTHVVQGQRSGIQRKADDGAHGGGEGEHKGGAAGGDAKAGGGGAEHQVSQPGDPAEQEADAVADNVAEGIHDGKDKKGGKGKDKGKEKKVAAGGAHGDEEDDHDGAHGHGDDAKGGGEAKGGGGAHGDANAKGGAHGGGDVKQAAPAQISAKLISRKIFRAPKPGGAPAAGGPATGAPASATASATAAGGPPGAPPPKPIAPGDEIAGVKKFCAPDPIAMQKLSDVDTEQHVEKEYTPASARAAFYKSVATFINNNPKTNPAAIFNATFDTAAKPMKFCGKKIPNDTLKRLCARTCGLGGWWGQIADQNAMKALAKAHAGASAPDAIVSRMAFNLWKARIKDGENLMATVDKSKTITPEKGTWFTDDKVNVGGGADGFNQLLNIFALQPEWFADGNVSFDISPAGFTGDCRKPTAYDGMQSSLWVSRPAAGDTFGVTGGGAREFLATGVKCSEIVTAKAVIPDADMLAQIKQAQQQVQQQYLESDPELRAKIAAAEASLASVPAGDADKKKAAQEALNAAKGELPNLTDQFIRNSAPAIRTLLAQRVDGALDLVSGVVGATKKERKNPSRSREGTGPVAAPAAGGASGGATSGASASASGTKGGPAAGKPRPGA
ncbi:MAG: hypothetical protein JWM53_6619 [bacterium]|nr:hypothetical protein [bacterium]